MSGTARDNTETGRRRHQNRPGRGFTMIELLVVIFILGILITLVVSISSYIMDKASRDQTIANQQVILTAIAAYHDILEAYPEDRDPPGGPYDYDASGGLLVMQLTAANEGNVRLKARITEATNKCLLSLPEEAFDGNVLKDAYGKGIAYQKTGGLGGRPVIISAGPDGKFNTEEDNIRSDGR